jgi:hypothetical protein
LQVPMCWLSVGYMVVGTALPALYWATDKVGGPESRSVTTEKPIPSQLQLLSYLVDLLWSKSTEILSCLVHQVLRSCWIRSSGAIFWKVFWRSCGQPTRSVGPTDRSAGLLVGRTHLSGTAVSLVGGDPGVPMSHINQFPNLIPLKVLQLLMHRINPIMIR